MAKKKFNISSTLNKNKEEESKLIAKVPLPQRKKDIEEVKEKVEEIHKDEKIVKTSAEKAKKTSPKRTPRKVAKPPKLVRLTIDTPEDMHKKLKIQAIQSNMSMRDFILRLLERNLK